MFDQTNTQTILAQYAYGPSLLDSVLSGLRETDLDLALGADSWSIRQIVHHLADGDDIWKTRIKIALGNENGLFLLQRYWEKPQMEWSKNWRYTSRSIDSSLALLRANHRHVVELIRMGPDTWGKSARLKRPDGEEERVTVGWVIGMQAEHAAEHIKDIQTVLNAQQREAGS